MRRLRSPRVLCAGTATALRVGAAVPAPTAICSTRPHFSAAAGKAFSLVVSKSTGFNAAALGLGPVPLGSQESRRRPGCSRLRKSAHFYFVTRISSMSLLSCII